MLPIYLAGFFAPVSISITQILYGIIYIQFIYCLYQGRIKLTKNKYAYYIFGVMLAVAVTAVFGDSPERSFLKYKQVFWLMNFFVGYYMFFAELPISGIPGLSEKTPQDKLINFSLFVAAGGALSAVYGYARFLIWELNLYTVGGFFRSPVRYGNMTALISMLIICIIIFKLYRSKKELLFFASTLMFSFLGLLGSTTRGALLAFFTTLFILFIFKYRWRGALFIAGVLIITALSIWIFHKTVGLNPNVLYKLRTTYNFDPKTSVGWRFVLWEESFRIFNLHPVMGVGLDNLNPYLEALPKPLRTTSSDHAHNNALQILAEHGIFGFVVISALMLRLFASYVGAVMKKNVYGAAGALLVIVISLEGLTEYGFFNGEISMLFWLLNGVLAGLIPKMQKEVQL